MPCAANRCFRNPLCTNDLNANTGIQNRTAGGVDEWPFQSCHSHSEERRDEESAVINLSFRIRFSGEESAFCKTVGTFSKPRRGRCPHLPNTLPFPIVILRQRSPSPREGLPTKDPCIPAQAKPRQPAGASFSRLFAKGCRRS